MKTLTWIFINEWNAVQITKHPVTMEKQQSEMGVMQIIHAKYQRLEWGG